MWRPLPMHSLSLGTFCRLSAQNCQQLFVKPQLLNSSWVTSALPEERKGNARVTRTRHLQTHTPVYLFSIDLPSLHHLANLSNHHHVEKHRNSTTNEACMASFFFFFFFFLRPFCHTVLCCLSRSRHTNISDSDL